MLALLLQGMCPTCRSMGLWMVLPWVIFWIIVGVIIVAVIWILARRPRR